MCLNLHGLYAFLLLLLNLATCHRLGCHHCQHLFYDRVSLLLVSLVLKSQILYCQIVSSQVSNPQALCSQVSDSRDFACLSSHHCYHHHLSNSLFWDQLLSQTY